MFSPIGLGDMEKTKYHTIFDQIRQYQYCDNTVVD